MRISNEKEMSRGLEVEGGTLELLLATFLKVNSVVTLNSPQIQLNSRTYYEMKWWR